jgi:(2R)-3-sulfolactate dehydrogenase (NADP+)
VQTDFLTARSWCAALLEAHGMDRAPAERTAWALTMAEVWGRPSHGLLRLPFYLERFDAGGTDPHAVLGEVRSTSVTAALDGGNGLGHWQVWEASRRAAQMATSHGIAAVSVANSGHCGVLGLYVLPLVDAGLIGLVFSTGPAVMAAPGGRRAVVSTSPIAAGIPTHPRPAIIDLATSAVARGRIAAHAASGEPLEEGWALDETGEPTTDAARALGGMLAPLGGAKGFALAFLVESMTGAMVGPLLATEIADCTSSAAASMLRFRLNCRVIWVEPTVLTEFMSSRPSIVANCFSSGSATEEAMMSGLAPGSEAETTMVGKSTFGSAATDSSR